jgi:hypothetical protein
VPSQIELYRTSQVTAGKIHFEYMRRFDGDDEPPVIKDAIANGLVDLAF